MTRGLLLTILIWCELSVLAALGAIVFWGAVPGDPAVLIWAGVLLLALSVSLPAGLGLRAARRVATHGALWVGSVVFALPFVWLVTTSFKYPEETFVYPPRWVPVVPSAVASSPYVDPDPIGSEGAREAWDTFTSGSPVEHAAARLWSAAMPMLEDDVIDELDADRLGEAMVPGLFQAARARVPGEFWQQADDAHRLDRLVDELNPTLVHQVFRRVYRGVELGTLTVRDAQGNTHAVVPMISDDAQGPLPTPWRLEESGARASLVPLGSGQSGPRATLLRYAEMDAGDVVHVWQRFVMPIDAASMAVVTLPMRQDRSWHRVTATLEVDGEAYETTDALYLGEAGYRDLSFKRAGPDETDERELGIWPMSRVSEVASTSARGDATLRLSIEAMPRWEMLVAKYTQSYRNAWYADSNWPNYLWNSLYLVVLNVLGQLLSCSLAAFAFSRLHWPGREWVFGLVLGTMMLPATVMFIPQFLIFKQVGWYNTLLPLWVPAFTATPFFIFLLRQFMLAMPRELEEAARIDGSGWFGVYWRVTLPLLRPALAAVAIFTFINVWNDFMGPLIFLSDERKFPLSLGLYNFQSEHGGDFGMLMAASTLMVLPVMAVFFLAQRQFIEGVTFTGMKG